MSYNKKVFSGENELGENALWCAIHECGIDHNKENFPGEEIEVVAMIYAWLEDSPRTTLVVELSKKLNELGYKIVRA